MWCSDWKLTPDQRNQIMRKALVGQTFESGDPDWCWFGKNLGGGFKVNRKAWMVNRRKASFLFRCNPCPEGYDFTAVLPYNGVVWRDQFSPLEWQRTCPLQESRAGNNGRNCYCATLPQVQKNRSAPKISDGMQDSFRRRAEQLRHVLV